MFLYTDDNSRYVTSTANKHLVTDKQWSSLHPSPQQVAQAHVIQSSVPQGSIASSYFWS